MNGVHDMFHNGVSLGSHWVWKMAVSLENRKNPEIL